MNLVWITSAQYISDYKILLTFNTNEQKVFDFADFINGNSMFHPLKSHDLFKRFKLDGWTLQWDNGNIDVAPEYLYENGFAVQ